MHPRLRLVLPLVTASALLTTLLAGAAANQPAVAKAAKPKLPDLVVSPGELRGDHYLLLGKRYGGDWKGVVKNKGSAVAAPSITRVYIASTRLQRNVRARDRILQAAVPRLRAGAQERVTAEYRPARNDPVPGGYSVWVCADATNRVRESNEKNNCRSVAPRDLRFYVGFEKWTGSLSGHGPMTWGGSTREDWSGTDILLTMSSVVEAAGVFAYDLSGNVHYEVSGTSTGGCTASGSGNVAAAAGPLPGYLRLYYEREFYLGGAAGTGSDYDYLLDCGGTVSPYPGAQNYLFFNTGPEFPPLPFGAKTISGTYTDSDGVVYNYSFRGIR